MRPCRPASSAPGAGELIGINTAFGGADAAGTCANQGLDNFSCPGTGYNNYTFEVVDPVGNDSYIPGHGVLLAKSRNGNGQPNVWIIDPNPQDIGMIDFYRPDGTPVAVVPGDPRQLNDATMHAGTGSGSAYEYVDTFNKLHFYVVDTSRDDDGVLQYQLAVRRVDNGDPFVRGVTLGKPAKRGQRRHDRRAQDLHVPAQEHRPGRSGAVRPRRLPHLCDVEQRRLEADAAERAGGSEGRRGGGEGRPFMRSGRAATRQRR